MGISTHSHIGGVIGMGGEDWVVYEKSAHRKGGEKTGEHLLGVYTMRAGFNVARVFPVYNRGA